MNDLSKFITKYNISKDDLILLSELYSNRKKFKNIPFSKDYGKITNEILLIQKKYNLSFLDSGNIVLLIGKVPQITYDNYDDILNENKTSISTEKTEKIIEEKSNNPSTHGINGAITNKTTPKSKSKGGVIVLAVFVVIIFFIFKRFGGESIPDNFKDKKLYNVADKRDWIILKSDGTFVLHQTSADVRVDEYGDLMGIGEVSFEWNGKVDGLTLIPNKKLEYKGPSDYKPTTIDPNMEFLDISGEFLRINSTSFNTISGSKNTTGSNYMP